MGDEYTLHQQHQHVLPLSSSNTHNTHNTHNLHNHSFHFEDNINIGDNNHNQIHQDHNSSHDNNGSNPNEIIHDPNNPDMNNNLTNNNGLIEDANGEPMSTIQCIYCSTPLSYPSSSLYIQCPKCSNTMNPSAPTISYVTCLGCKTLLSHPPSSLTIQCPKCMIIMDLPNNQRPNDLNGDMRINSSLSSGGMSLQGVNGSLNVPGVSSNEASRKLKKKDPNAPKRASNAYMIFCKEQRGDLKDKNPDLAFGKIGARLGEIWRQMTPEEKKPYEIRASGDRERYKKEMNNYAGSKPMPNSLMNDPLNNNGMPIGLNVNGMNMNLPINMNMVNMQQLSGMSSMVAPVNVNIPITSQQLLMQQQQIPGSLPQNPNNVNTTMVMNNGIGHLMMIPQHQLQTWQQQSETHLIDNNNVIHTSINNLNNINNVMNNTLQTVRLNPIQMQNQLNDNNQDSENNNKRRKLENQQDQGEGDEEGEGEEDQDDHEGTENNNILEGSAGTANGGASLDNNNGNGANSAVDNDNSAHILTTIIPNAVKNNIPNNNMGWNSSISQAPAMYNGLAAFSNLPETVLSQTQTILKSEPNQSQSFQNEQKDIPTSSSEPKSQ